MKPFNFSIAVEQEKLHLSGIRLLPSFSQFFWISHEPSLYNKLYKVQFGATYDSFKEDNKTSASLQYPGFWEQIIDNGF